MPDDIAAHMRARGAEQVTIRARMAEGERLQRHAAWRLPMSHEDMPRLDRLRAAGHLDARRYANACAAQRLWETAGQGRSAGVAAYLRTCRTSGDGDEEQQSAEDDLRRLIATGGVGVQAVLMLVRGDEMGPYMWQRAHDALDDLDWLQARYSGEMWSAD